MTVTKIIWIAPLLLLLLLPGFQGQALAPSGQAAAAVSSGAGDAVPRRGGPSNVAAGMGAPAPGENATNGSQPVSNLAFALTAGLARFGPNSTLILSDVSPAVTYFATVPRYHAGNVRTANFLSSNFSYQGAWLGTPNVALLGWINGTRTYVLMNLDSPSVSGRIVRFQTTLLTPDDRPTLADGPVGALMIDYSLGQGNSRRFLSSVDGNVRLVDVSLVVESAMMEVPSAGLKASATTSSSNDGFTYDCNADTVWKPIWCNRFSYGYGGFGRGFLGR